MITQGHLGLAAPTEDSVFFFAVPVTDPAPGRWEATVDWAIDTNTLWMWVANGACSAEQFARPECPFEAECPCQFAVRSETALPKPRVLTIPNAPGGTRTLFVLNLGPREEEVEYRVTLTSSGTVSGHAVPAGARHGDASARPSVGRKALRLD